MEAITRKEQKERTRERLVNQAEILFSQNGIAITTTADVAKAIDVSHGTVFVHFKTREELILSVVERFADRLAADMGKRFVEDMNLRDLLKAHVSVLSDFEDFYMRLISESQTLPAQVRSIVYSINASLSYRFFRAAQVLMKEGKVKKIEQAYFFNTWMALVNYYILNRDLFSDKTPILKEHGELIIRHFFNLIKT